MGVSVQSLDERKAVSAYARQLQEQVFPDLRVAVLHGKMKPKEKERVMAAFAAGESDILVSTTVVEVGVDVPNATCMPTGWCCSRCTRCGAGGAGARKKATASCCRTAGTRKPGPG